MIFIVCNCMPLCYIGVKSRRSDDDLRPKDYRTCKNYRILHSNKINKIKEQLWSMSSEKCTTLIQRENCTMKSNSDVSLGSDVYSKGIYDRLPLVIHPDSLLSSIALLYQILSAMKLIYLIKYSHIFY